MVKMRKRVFVVSVCAIFVILSLWFVVAEEGTNERAGADNRAKNFLSDNAFVQKIRQNAPAWLGFNGTDMSWLYYLFIGSFAGFMIWVVYTVTRFLRRWVDKSLYLKIGEEIKEDWSRWPELVAGRPWKFILLGVLYAVLMVVPMVNRVLQIITLEIFDLGVFLHALVVACEVGFLPWMFESYMRARLKAKYERAYRKARPAAS